MVKPKQVLKPRVQTAAKDPHAKELQSKFNVGKKLPLLMLSLFAMIGAVIGGYVLLRSNAESDCNTASTSGYNACVTAYYVSNLHPGPDCSVGGPGVPLKEQTDWMKQKFGKNVFVNEPPRSYLSKDSNTWTQNDPYYTELGCSAYTSTGAIVVEMRNTGTTDWDVGKVIGDATATHLKTVNVSSLDFGSQFHSIDTISAGDFVLQRYAYKGSMPDVSVYGKGLSSLTPDCPDNTCLSNGQSVKPGETIWTSTPIYYGNSFTTNKDYAVELQMINNAGALFGNKVTISVTARNGGIEPPSLASKSVVCLLQVEGRADPAKPSVIGNYVVAVPGASPVSCTQAQYDESGFNPSKPSTSTTAPKVKQKPAPLGSWQ